jgi:histidinol dehydrogenase
MLADNAHETYISWICLQTIFNYTATYQLPTVSPDAWVTQKAAMCLLSFCSCAGCGTVVLATPPRPDGSITPEVLYCAKKAGVTHLLKAGGAQAVAAMGWGTQTVPKVDKIFGPGNQFVTAAKMLLTNSEAMVAIDMPAGPSEVLVIAGACTGS